MSGRGRSGFSAVMSAAFQRVISPMKMRLSTSPVRRSWALGNLGRLTMGLMPVMATGSALASPACTRAMVASKRK